jgi:hypothetical protein
MKVAALTGGFRVRVPQRLQACVFMFCLLCQESEGAASSERRLMKKLKHAEFVYGAPPCTTHCGSVPSQCTVRGYFYNDVYIFWYDENDKVCKHFKSTVPTDTASAWTKSAFWGGIVAFVYELRDGFNPTDILSLFFGYWIKSYHDELSEDYRQIKGDMNMLGAPPEESDERENDEL